MKKIFAVAAGLTGLLSSCMVMGSGGGGGVDPVRNLQLLAYQSQYVLPAAYTDTGTGTVYPAGSSIICDNRSTRLSVTVQWQGSIDNLGVRLEGAKYGGTQTVFSDPLGGLYSPSPTSFDITLGANVAPLKVGTRTLGAQGITVNPVNTFTVKGATFVTVQARSADGTLSNVVRSVQALPVADCQ